MDQRERIDGKWKIRHRACVRDMSMTSYVERDDYAAYGCAEGTREGTDLGAALIGIVHTR